MVSPIGAPGLYSPPPTYVPEVQNRALTALNPPPRDISDTLTVGNSGSFRVTKETVKNSESNPYNAVRTIRATNAALLVDFLV